MSEASQLIDIGETKTKFVSPQGQYQDWIARFCYAAAKLPVGHVEHFLDLMETCSESEGTGLTHKEGNA